MEQNKNLEQPEGNEETLGEEMDSVDDSVATSEIELDPEAVAILQQELEEALQKQEEYLGGWQRSQADFSNYKKRVEREQAESYHRAAGRAAGRSLDILDDLGLALKDRPTEGDGASWAEGIDLVYRKILGFLESDGIKPMDAEGAQFDPNFHEAITTEDNEDYQSGQIIEVLQVGFIQNDKVIRPARVRVAN